MRIFGSRGLVFSVLLQSWPQKWQWKLWQMWLVHALHEMSRQIGLAAGPNKTRFKKKKKYTSEWNIFYSYTECSTWTISDENIAVLCYIPVRIFWSRICVFLYAFRAQHALVITLAFIWVSAWLKLLMAEWKSYLYYFLLCQNYCQVGQTWT